MQGQIKDIASEVLASTNATVEVRTSAKAVGVMLTCVISAVFSVGGYVANVFTDTEAEKLEHRLDSKIDRLDDRLSGQYKELRVTLDHHNAQLAEIAKTVGAKQILSTASSASLPSSSSVLK